MQSWFDSVCANLNPKNTKKGWAKIARLYRRQLEDTVLLDAYFTSCIVRLPPGLKVDEMQMCGESGYIHSIGSLLYFAPTTSADYLSWNLELKGISIGLAAEEDVFQCLLSRGFHVVRSRPGERTS